MLILVRDQLFEPLVNNIVNMDFACNHRLNAFELAWTLISSAPHLNCSLTRYKCIHNILEFLVIVCKTTLDRDFLHDEGHERNFHLRLVNPLVHAACKGDLQVSQSTMQHSYTPPYTLAHLCPL